MDDRREYISVFHKYKSTYKSAFYDLAHHNLFLFLSLYSVYYFKKSVLYFFTIPLLTLMLLRTFMIFHDCGHNSYTPNRNINFILGSFYGVIITTPFSWSSQHYIHHLVNGNPENHYNHKWSDTIHYSTIEYKLLDINYRILYRFMREPFIYFLFFPLIQNFIIFRFSIFEKNGYNYSSLQKYIDWVINNIGIIIQQYLLYKYSIITHYNIAHYLSCILTLILFHSQHTFNPPYVVDNESWNLQDSSIKGSSFIEIPKYLKYFTMGIEYHYIHHYAIRIPGYNLQKYHEIFKISMQQEVIKLSIKDLFKNLALTLYDTENSKFVSFYEIENDNKLNKSNKSN